MESFKKYVAETVGTCLLVFFGCGTACLVGVGSGTGYILTALAFGLVLLAMCYCIGNISGCHLNPAVSLAMLLLKRISLIDCVGYMASQYIGAIIGSSFLYLIFNNSALTDLTGTLGANGITSLDGNVGMAIFIEAILTFAFVLTVVGVTSKTENKTTAGIASGLALMLVHVLGIGFTGTSVNPARSLGPALFNRDTALGDLWIFFVGPIIGALLAALLWLFFEKGTKRSTAKS